MHSGAKATRKGWIMEEIRCFSCNKKLAEAEFIRIAIKCPRCGVLNQKASEPPALQENSHGKTNRSVDRR